MSDVAGDIIRKVRGNARVPPKVSPLPADHPARRPLGLKPIVDDDERTETAREPLPDGPPMRDPADNRVAYMSDIDMIGSVAGQVIGEAVNDLETAVRRKLDVIESAQRTEIAELKLTITELRCELREMKVIQEGARALSRGEQGVAGPRGVPGPPGPVGPRGEPGSKGLDAPKIVSWEIDEAEFIAYPLLSTSGKGPGLRLRPLFEVYDQQVNDRDDTEMAEAAAASRARNEREVAAKDWANR